MAKKRRRPAKRRSRASLKSRLAPWARDAIGIGLVVVALLAILALWLGSGGPFGALTRVAIRGAFGLGAVAFPVLSLYWGVLLLRDTVASASPSLAATTRTGRPARTSSTTRRRNSGS